MASTGNQGPYSVEVDGLSKQYRIGAKAEEGMLREALVRALQRPFRRGPEPNTVWALQDVSFTMERDEVVGVIGRNGSGKTTLLKLLARITYPTSGSVKAHGRVASLVEVGTGFHNELTGRENVFLNGSILGLKRKQIAEHFDAIVEFSGVGAFLDTPIKRYSTGMRLRLGFAVAAHLFPDVLLVDEVLAVGDAEFQQRCLETLHNVGQGGNAVLFVSHNLEAIESICPRTLWIDKGRLRMDGPSREVIAAYMQEAGHAQEARVDLGSMSQRTGSGEARFTSLEFLDGAGKPLEEICGGDTVTLRLHIDVQRPVQRPYVGVMISTELGALVAHPNTWTNEFDMPALEPGEHTLDLHIETLNLMPGRYPLSLWMNRQGDTQHIDNLDQCATLLVHPPDRQVLGRILDRRTGAVFFQTRWELSS